MSGWADAIKTALPNLAQGGSITRASIQAAAGGVFVQGISTWDWRLTALGAVAWLAAAGWGVLRHTNAAKIDEVAEMSGPDKTAAFEGVSVDVKLAAVEALPGVRTIIATRDAKGGVLAAANDMNRPKVVKS